MTIAEETKIIAAAKAGDEDAAVKLVGEYMPLIKHAAAVVNKRGLYALYDDAFGAAQLGFWRCVTEYDGSRGANFAAYAKLRVVGAVRDFLRNERKNGDNAPLEEAENIGAPPPADTCTSLPPLSRAERDVLRLLVAGYKEREIAEFCGRSQQTISKTKMRLRKKFAAHLRGDETKTITGR